MLRSGTKPRNHGPVARDTFRSYWEGRPKSNTSSCAARVRRVFLKPSTFTALADYSHTITGAQGICVPIYYHFYASQ